MTAGFIGLGAIGRPIAERLAAHIETTVYDIRDAATAPFKGSAGIGLSPADVAAKSDVVFGCLASLDAYRSAIIDSQGIFGGRTRVYVHLGTTGSALAQELEAALRTHGIAMIDAPITGGVPRAKDGTLTSMVSGPKEIVEQVKPLLLSYSSHVIYLGERVGAAQTMKVINNMLSAANLANAAEGLVLGVKAGLDPETMLQVINAGTGQNSATLTKIPNNILTRRFDYGGSLSISTKYLDAFMREARALGVETPLSAGVHRAYLDAAAEGAAGLDMTVVIRPMEKRAHVEVKGHDA